jgi:hypothetical protein
MPQILYTLQFTGKATPVNTAGTIPQAYTTAPSCPLTTVTGAYGVCSTLQPTPGGEATLSLQVRRQFILTLSLLSESRHRRGAG